MKYIIPQCYNTDIDKTQVQAALVSRGCKQVNNPPEMGQQFTYLYTRDVDKHLTFNILHLFYYSIDSVYYVLECSYSWLHSIIMLVVS